jgi:TonB family protein
MLETLFSSPFLTSLSLTLLHFLWQGLLVATVLKSALLLFNHNKPQLRYALSALAMLVNLLLPIITFIVLYRAEVSSVSSFASSLALNEFIQELQQPDALFSYKTLTETLPLLLPYISILWLTTITLLAGKLLVEISIVNRLPQQGTIAPTDKLQARFLELVEQINLTITPRLLVSLKVEVPMAIGWLKPVVLLPANMISGLNNAQLEMLILHELAHIRRHDYLVNFLQTIVEILLFFHPAVLWVSKQMRNEREYCSDDIAVQHCGDAIAYAHTLADTASLCTKAHNHTIPDMAMAASGGDLKQRVIRLVDHHCAPSNNISKWLASATIIFSILLLSSKQLLTMPLLDIWHIENPWSKSELALDNNEGQINITTASNNGTDQLLSNTSIAQQLLTPKKLDSKPDSLITLKNVQPVKPKVIEKKERDLTAIVLKESVETLNIDPQTVLNKPLLNSNKTNEIDTSLNLLSKNPVEHKDDIENTLSQNSFIAEEAFKRTNSRSEPQQQLATLMTNQTEVNNNSLRSGLVPNLVKSQHANLLTNTPSDNQLDYPLSNKNLTNSRAETSKVIEKTMHTLPINNSAIVDVTKSSAPILLRAKQLVSADPVYPSVAKRKGIEIEVEVNFTIGVDGQIQDILFIHKNKTNYFKSAIRTAIKKWRFLPAKVDGKPVESQMSKVFAFSLES